MLLPRGGLPRRAAIQTDRQAGRSKQTPTPGRHTAARLMRCRAARAARAARSFASTLPTVRPTPAGPSYSSMAASPSGPSRNLWRPGRGTAAAAAVAAAAAAAVAAAAVAVAALGPRLRRSRTRHGTTLRGRTRGCGGRCLLPPTLHSTSRSLENSLAPTLLTSCHPYLPATLASLPPCLPASLPPCLSPLPPPPPTTPTRQPPGARHGRADRHLRCRGLAHRGPHGRRLGRRSRPGGWAAAAGPDARPARRAPAARPHVLRLGGRSRLLAVDALLRNPS